MAEDKALEEQRIAEEESGPLIKKAVLGKKKEDGDGVVKRPVIGMKSKFKRR
ncbi:hypothetical protein BU25DRAFT_411434 [Macroventuria anomochaeta]|uniref:Uncharacterized protein n=1 Tax=Macroventuria anomochaeta TaxID=301207 RepID=A0ACB6S0H8_9PLEO|nr:uncharacterized protein BU25DRAFT_411434 [Macroventuria anomochaeta]KAF2626903.1 hypothetical protein BU25DRAFT_411434 [Macroventuria anomochaeta]